MQITIEITPERIADMMIGAIEGSSTYWCAGVFLAPPAEKAPLAEPWYSDPKLYAGEFALEVHERAEDDEGPPRVHRVTQDDFSKGLALMAKNGGQHFGDMMAETDDATTADVFLQFVALGEIRYG